MLFRSLTLQNVQGVQTTEAINLFLDTKFGFRNIILDKMAQERIETSISEKGKSREELIKMTENLGAKINDEQTINTLLSNMGK